MSLILCCFCAISLPLWDTTREFAIALPGGRRLVELEAPSSTPRAPGFSTRQSDIFIFFPHRPITDTTQFSSFRSRTGTTIQTHIISPSSSSSIITYQHQFKHGIQHDGVARAAPSQRLKPGRGTVVGSGYGPGTQTAWTGNIQWGAEVKALEVERGRSPRAKGNRKAARQVGNVTREARLYQSGMDLM
ncbi:hypothetical protein BKA70DRAFT_1398903 [Coprinopsis sp. MPI-PUGE-AT-0042]|nr:hypothetical protein BKA70DRAFT_1398903 [Coprinopsis sp. MPI-PUGE-AT-0042]